MASSYGWSEADILSLPWDRALAYMAYAATSQPPPDESPLLPEEEELARMLRALKSNSNPSDKSDLSDLSDKSKIQEAS